MPRAAAGRFPCVRGLKGQVPDRPTNHVMGAQRALLSLESICLLHFEASVSKPAVSFSILNTFLFLHVSFSSASCSSLRFIFCYHEVFTCHLNCFFNNIVQCYSLLHIFLSRTFSIISNTNPNNAYI